MTSTKVECQEMSTDSPNVEEIASYSYTLHEENNQKPLNGMLIEEYSESEDNQKGKLNVNRGISIVSVSDDESTLKGISRDVSGDDIHNSELLSMNGIHEEIYSENGRIAEEKSVENLTPYGAMRYTETIIEERSIDESLSGKTPVRTEIIETSKTHRASIIEGRLSRQSSVAEESPKHAGTQNSPIAQNAKLQDGKLTRRSSQISRFDSTEEEISVKIDLEKSQNAVIENGKLSRQSSTISRTESVEEKVAKKTILEESKRASVEESKISRQNSKIERMDSVESSKGKIDRVSRQNSQQAVKNGEEEIDEEMEALLERIQQQRSVLNEILDKEGEGEGSGIENRIFQFKSKVIILISIRVNLPCHHFYNLFCILVKNESIFMFSAFVQATMSR